jgi:hypothetical protein
MGKLLRQIVHNGVFEIVLVIVESGHVEGVLQPVALHRAAHEGDEVVTVLGMHGVILSTRHQEYGYADPSKFFAHDQ